MVPCHREYADPQTYARAIASSGPAYEAMQSIGEVEFYNDSKATNVAAAIASIRSVEGMLVLIAGGEGKGGDFSALAEPLENKLRAAVLIGSWRDDDFDPITIDSPSVKLRGPVYLPEKKVVTSPYDGALRVGGTMELSGVNEAFDKRRHKLLQPGHDVVKNLRC